MKHILMPQLLSIIVLAWKYQWKRTDISEMDIIVYGNLGYKQVHITNIVKGMIFNKQYCDKWTIYKKD